MIEQKQKLLLVSVLAFLYGGRPGTSLYIGLSLHSMTLISGPLFLQDDMAVLFLNDCLIENS